MKEYARAFYKSKQWQDTRRAYLSSVHGLCERCAKKGLIVPAKLVHHKQYLRPTNINDPNITLAWHNLEALCQDCHAWEHHGQYGPTIEGLMFDESGNLIVLYLVLGNLKLHNISTFQKMVKTPELTEAFV